MAGIIVEHKVSKVRYAVSEDNFNPKKHTRVRALKPGETVTGYQPRTKTQTKNTETAAPAKDVSTDQKG